VTVQALSHTNVNRIVGDVWDLLVDVRDADGVLVDAAPTVTVTLPDGSTSSPTSETVSTGIYRAQYIPASSGRHVATVTSAGYGLVAFTAQVAAITANASMPTVANYRTYDEDNGASWTDAQIQGALDTESAAQAAVCRVGAIYSADLREALLRRVMCNLSRRGLPLAVLQGDAEAGSSSVMPPGRDPEVRRLEGPYRRLAVG
jgi:hypothetical protein